MRLWWRTPDEDSDSLSELEDSSRPLLYTAQITPCLIRSSPNTFIKCKRFFTVFSTHDLGENYYVYSRHKKIKICEIVYFFNIKSCAHEQIKNAYTINDECESTVLDAQKINDNKNNEKLQYENQLLSLLISECETASAHKIIDI